MAWCLGLAALTLPGSAEGEREESGSVEDAYETRVGEDFVENTTFRFRTKFNRTYDDSEEFKTVVSRPVDVPPLLDGVLEDACWQAADHSKTAFIQWLSRESNRKQSVFYVCHDAENLYMAVVCEEPQPKSVRMLSHHPGGIAKWSTAGDGDSIETFIEMGGVGGVGQVFQFIFNIYPEVRYDGLYPPYVPFIGTGYKLAGSMGGKRWICELAFPYKGFNTEKTDQVHYRYEGPPRRGEVWGLRIVRNGPRPEHGEEQMRSTWTFNPVRAWHIPYPTGIIVFEHRNALENGKMMEVDPNTGRPLHWKLSKGGDRVEGDLVFDGRAGHAVLSGKIHQGTQGLQVSQKVGVLPNVGYKLSARLQKTAGEGKVIIGIDRPLTQHEFEKVGEWEKHEVDFFTEPGQREATVFINLLEASASVFIDEVVVEQQIYGAPTGAICLTGNSPRKDVNLEGPTLEAVQYTYREPGTDREEFPYRKEWTPGWVHGFPDQGGTTGWIPAVKGSLTSPEGRMMIQWSHPRPTAGWVPYPKGHELIFDLGKEYYVRAVEVLPSGPIENMTVHVRPDASQEYILSRRLRGEGVLNPPGPVLYGRLDRINSVVRYVKIWFDDGGHGLYFVRIWGEEKGERRGVTRFRWKEGLVTPEVKYSQFRKLPGPVLMPTPQETVWGEGGLVLRGGMPVVYVPGGHGESTARILADEVFDLFGIRLELRAERGGEGLEAARGAIVLGESDSPGLAARLAQARGWTIDSKRPGEQGYFLSAAPEGILVCGFDQAGTFYGVQTLLQLLVRRDESSAAARSVEVRDWPYIPARMIDCRGGLTSAFIRALARLKVNVVLGSDNPRLDDYFMRTGPAWAGHSGGSPIEMDDDENWYYLGSGSAGTMRINVCPSHYQRYEFYDAAARQASAGDDIAEININTDEMDGVEGGSRWNADRQCRLRGMTGDELFTEMVIRAYDLFRLRNCKTAILDTMMVAGFEGGNGSFHDMYKAYDRIPEDMHVFCWKGIAGDPTSDPEEAVRRFERATMLQTSFPHQNRGRLNEFYQAPPGRRIFGSWNTVWGVAGPVDQVLTGQFCRSMTMVDGGCTIPYMTQAWNPDSPPVHTEEWALRMGHFQQRLGELALERELPSWREGMPKEFFPVDLRPACNESHIDPVPGDGKGWLDWGPNNDLSRMPVGNIQFEEIPFQVLDPASNGGKSIVMVAAQSENARLTLPSASPEIPVGRKAASLIFVRTNVGGGFLPGYRVTYEGKRFLTVELDAMGNLANGPSCYDGFYLPGKESAAPDDPRAFYKAARHRMVEIFSLFFRPAWLGTTGAGDPVKLTLHEWVNPYPELNIESVSVRYPRGRQSGRIEVLLAITGIAPVSRDLALWSGRERLPLVPANEVEVGPEDVPVMPADGKWLEAEGDPKTYLDTEGKEIAQVTGFFMADKHTDNTGFFLCRDNTWLGDGGMIRLAFPQVCKKVALRGQFFWEYHGAKVHYGVTSFRRTDYVVEVSADGAQWTPVGSKAGISGEDGEHVHALPATPIQHVRVRLDARRYPTARSGPTSAGAGLTWLQLYR
ncbi:MAG: hypothetical protein HYU36_23655 [Planctomycetes bacterium]|nr:hypothetical protein [Planctomycetota bacterium]